MLVSLFSGNFRRHLRGHPHITKNGHKANEPNNRL
jgi:hypothetical protein